MHIIMPGKLPFKGRLDKLNYLVPLIILMALLRSVQNSETLIRTCGLSEASEVNVDAIPIRDTSKNFIFVQQAVQAWQLD